MLDTQIARHWFMHTSHVSVGIGDSKKVVSREALLPPISRLASSPKQEERLLRVGLVAGPESTWGLAAERLAEHFFRDPCLEISQAWDCVDLGIDDTTDYDCLVLLGWPTAGCRKQIKQIEYYCRGGGSFVALSAMHAQIPGWPSFAEEVLGGRQLPGQRSRLLEAERSDCAWHHPVVQGVETLIAEGDIYCGPRFSPDTTVLLRAVSPAQSGRSDHLPVAWVKRHAGGRVFCTTLGREDDFREPSFLRLISNAVHWAGLVHA